MPQASYKDWSPLFNTSGFTGGCKLCLHLDQPVNGPQEERNFSSRGMESDEV